MTNPRRDQMVKNIIGAHTDEPITVEALAKYLPDNFDLRDDDLAPYQETEPTPAQRDAAAMVQSLLSGEPLPTEFEAESAPTPAVTQPPSALAEPVKLAPADPEAIEAATLRRITADQTLANARVAVTAAQNVERDARGKLAQAVTTFQTGFPKVTREQLMRDYIASEQDRKAAGHVSRPQGQPGKSAVDRTAFYGRGGNPAGGGAAYRRGAYAASAKGAPNYDPRRGAVVAQPKVPAER